MIHYTSTMSLYWRKLIWVDFFLKKWELQLVQKNIYWNWQFFRFLLFKFQRLSFKYIYFVQLRINYVYNWTQKKLTIEQLVEAQCEFRREVQCMNQLLRILNDYTWLQKITCKERQNQIFLCSILYLVEQNI